MLKRVVAKACNQLVLTDQFGNRHGLKLDNFGSASQRAIRADRQVVTDPDTTLQAGHILDLDDKSLILVRKDPDFHRGEVLRYTFDAILTTHKVNVVRSTLNHNTRGGLLSKTDVTVKVGLVGKVALRENVGSKDVDTFSTQFIMLISKLEDVQIEDRLVPDDTTMLTVKVNSVVPVELGLKELWLDKDPRWP